MFWESTQGYRVSSFESRTKLKDCDAALSWLHYKVIAEQLIFLLKEHKNEKQNYDYKQTG